jgi:hypothetical protein
MVRRLLVAAVLAVFLAPISPAAAEEDILGPIGPMPAPSPDRHPTRRAVAVSIAVGFGVLSVYLTLRRRRRRHLVAPVAWEPVQPPGDELLDLPDDELYAALFRIARQAVGRSPALTPMELSHVAVCAGRGDWPGFCARVGDVLYARAGAAPEQRAADLRLVQDLFARPAEGGNGA